MFPPCGILRTRQLRRQYHPLVSEHRANRGPSTTPLIGNARECKLRNSNKQQVWSLRGQDPGGTGALGRGAAQTSVSCSSPGCCAAVAKPVGPSDAHLDTYCLLHVNCTSVTLIDNCALYNFQTSLGDTMGPCVHIWMSLRASHFKQ